MKVFKLLGALGLAALIAACGGGGGNPGTNGSGSGSTAPATATISLFIFNASGTKVNNVDATGVFTARATVLDAAGAPVKGKLVTFTSLGFTNLQVAPQTQSTDDSGVASVVVSPSITSTGGGVSLTATASFTGTTSTSATTTASAQVDFNVAAVTSTQPVLPAIVEVLTSSSTLTSGNGSSLTITAFVKNAANVGMAGQTVLFSTSSGTLQAAVGGSITDASGAVKVTLIPGSNKALRNITVTATASPAVGSVVIPVTGTLLSVSGSGSLKQSAIGSSKYTTRAVDSSGAPIVGASIAVQSKLNNSVVPSSITTDALGTATFNYTPTNPGNDTITVTGLGATAATDVAVSAIDFSVVTPDASVSIPQVEVNTGLTVVKFQTIQVKYQVNGVPQVNVPVLFSTTRGAFTTSSIATDSNGVATSLVYSSTAGPATVVAQIPSVGGLVSVPLVFVSKSPSTIIVQANPGSLAPNKNGSNTNQSIITALVRDASGNTVANQIVNFSLTKDLSNGTFGGDGTGVATTNADGVAQVSFIAGATSTASNGVIVTATIPGTAVTGNASLTVDNSSLFINIAFGNTITNLDVSTYSKPFSLYVTDANGKAVGNQQIVLSVVPITYSKGFLVLSITNEWVYSATSPTICANEDLNFNGFLDVGEDINGNGVLTPGNVAAATPGIVTTDGAGIATFNLIYGEQFVPWATVKITARGTVSGSESSRSISYPLEGLLTDFKDPQVPAGRYSPFGTATVCTNPN